MNLNHVLVIGSILIGFFSGFIGFLLLYKKIQTENVKKNNFLQTFTPFYLCMLILFSVLFYVTPDHEDFINPINFPDIIIPLLCGGIIFALPQIPKCARLGDVAVIGASVICSFLLPENFLFFNGALPFWADRCFIIAFWSVFSCFYYILNGSEGVLASQSMAIGIGLSLLVIFDGTPFLFCLFAACFAALNGALLIFNWYPAKLTLNKESCQALGFLTAWILFLNGGEGNISCGIIFAAFYLTELIEATVKKISLRQKYANLTVNSNYYQATISSASPSRVAFFVCKLLFILIILGCFQVFAPNPYSVPILGFIICIWFLSRLTNRQPELSIRELNKNLINDIKQNINNFRNFD